MDEIISTELEEKLLAELPRTIDHYTPEIFWHDRKQIMCLHIQQTMPDDQYVSDEGRRCDLRYKLCTVSVQDEVRVWEIVFSKSKHPGFENHYEMGVNFVANLVGHNSTLNVVQYSPDGQLIASGDVNGKMIIWKIYPHDENFVESEHKPLNDESAQFEIPPNKENWLRAFMPIGHDNDLNALAFSPNSQFICSAAHDDLRLTNARTGKAGWYNRNFRRLITGLTWDPRGRYIVTMSSDRRMDIVDAYKGYRLRTCHAHTIPEMVIDNKRFEMRNYKLFFDQHVYTLTRSPGFSPCGELLFAPAGQLETSEANIYGTYMFRRCDFNSCVPRAFYPCIKPTLMVRVAPVKYELRKDTDQNLSELPYRMIFAVMCAESIFFFDTQTEEPIGFVYDMSYDNLTSISWSPDGRILAVSSLEGFNTFLQIRTNELVPTELIIERPISPPLKKQKEPKPEAMEFNVDNNSGPGTPRSTKTTPKASKKPKNEEIPPSFQTTPTRKENAPKKRKITTFFSPLSEDNTEN